MAPLIKSATTAKILKALSIFGGVQVLQILCSVVRTKLVAVWIGPAGVGLLALYNSTMEFLASTTQLNLRQSAVRDLSITGNDEDAAARTSAVVRKLALVLGIAGMAIGIIAAPLLGWWSFGDAWHSAPYLLLSPMLLLGAVTSGEWAIMQGRDKLRSLAKSTLYASLAATAVSIPLFYFFRLDGIVPVLLSFAVCNCFFALLFRNKYSSRVAMSLRRAWTEGREMLSLGLYMTVSSSVTLLASYIFIAWLNRSYSTDTAGLYQAGYTLVNTYTGMIFTAIAMEFYPRLSAAAKHRSRVEVIVSHEIKIALWLLLPVIIIFICARGLIVDILYSGNFDAILPYIAIAITGVALRAASWCMAYTMLARGDGRIYIVTEATSAVTYLVLNILLFRSMGFAGLGIAYILWYGIYTAACYCVYRLRYGLRLRRGIGSLLALVIAAGLMALVLDSLIGPWWTAALMLPPAAYMCVKAVKR